MTDVAAIALIALPGAFILIVLRVAGSLTPRTPPAFSEDAEVAPRPQHHFDHLADGFNLHVYAATDGRESWSVTVEAGERWEASIEITRQLKGPSHSDLSVGDPEFDRQIRLAGPETLLVAMLSAPVRERVMRLVGSAGARILGRQIQHVTADAGVVEEMTQLARLLCLRNADIPKALARNVAEERLLAVRVRNFELLFKDYRALPLTQETARSLLRDPELAIRLVAARALGGEEGLEVLRALVTNEDAPPSVRARALRALREGHAYGRYARVVELALAHSEKELQLAAIETVGDVYDLSLANRVIELAKSEDDAVAATAAEALGKLDAPGGEAAVIGLLSRSSERARRAALGALERIGTVAAVEGLLELQRLPAFEPLARDAVRAIQGRLSDAEAGRVSLAPSVAGGVSVAETSGAVSLPAKKRG